MSLFRDMSDKVDVLTIPADEGYPQSSLHSQRLTLFDEPVSLQLPK